MLGLIGLTAAFIVVTGCVPDAPPPEPPVTTIHINEVESNGGTPGDWVELFNTGTTAGRRVRLDVLDNDDTHIPSVIPAGTTCRRRRLLHRRRGEPRLRPRGGRLGAPVRRQRRAGTRRYSVDRARRDDLRPLPERHRRVRHHDQLTKGAANDCSRPVRINEVESNGGPPGDWVELFNPGAIAVDLSGWTVQRQRRHPHPYADPGRHDHRRRRLLRRRGGAFGFGLGAADAPAVRPDRRAGRLLRVDGARHHHLRPLPERHRRVHDHDGVHQGRGQRTAPAMSSRPPWPGDAGDRSPPTPARVSAAT